MKILKALWLVLSFALLMVTLFGFDGKANSDIAIVLAWGGLFLSFPSGLLVSLAYVLLYEWFSIAPNVSYASLTIDWAAFFILGFMQWFVFLPWLWGKYRTKQGKHVISN